MRTKEEIQKDIRVWEDFLQQRIRERKEYSVSPLRHITGSDPVLQGYDDRIVKYQQRVSELYEELKTAW